MSELPTTRLTAEDIMSHLEYSAERFEARRRKARMRRAEEEGQRIAAQALATQAATRRAAEKAARAEARAAREIAKATRVDIPAELRAAEDRAGIAERLATLRGLKAKYPQGVPTELLEAAFPRRRGEG